MVVWENGVSVGMRHCPAEFAAGAVVLYRSRPERLKSVVGDLGGGGTDHWGIGSGPPAAAAARCLLLSAGRCPGWR